MLTNVSGNKWTLKAEKALIDANKRLDKIIEFLPDATFVIDQEGKVIAWNRAIEKMTGVPAEEMLGRGNYEYAIPFYGERRPVLIDLAIMSGSEPDRFACEYDHIQRDGETLVGEVHVPRTYGGKGAYLWGSASILRDSSGNMVGAIESIRDITDRKQAEEKLRESEEKMRLMARNIRDVVIETDINGICTYVSPSSRFVIGRGEELIGRSCFEHIHPEDQKLIIETFNQVIKTGVDARTEHRHLHPEEGYIWIESVGSTYKRDKETVVLFTARDITLRKKAEEELRQSEERFNKAFNSSPVGMAIHLLDDGSLIDVNNGFSEITGYPREEIVGKNKNFIDLNVMVDPEEWSNVLKVKELGVVKNVEVRLRRKTGGERLALFSAVLINISNEPCILCMAHDITELINYRNEIARLDRLNMIGEMAAGIGHEVRNPMTTVRGFLQLLRERDKYAQEREFFNLMIEELDRANSIITEFLSLAKTKAVNLEKKSLNKILRAILPLIRADGLVTDKHIKLETKKIPDLLLDEKEIRQLVLNLVKNGLEATPPGGNITIKAYQEGREVVMSVQDQGTGISTEILDRLGTPFLTTKDNGTGLGLPVCYSIAARHNGRIEVETGPSGTTFYVRFGLNNE